MASSDIDDIIKAILERGILSFEYDGFERICEPHVFGVTNKKNQVLCYQFGGGSRRGGIPQWRRFDISGISTLARTGEIFDGPRPLPKGPHSIWDSIILVVS